MDALQNDELRDIDRGTDINDWLPHEIAFWIKYEATRIGVPDTYIAIPLLVSIAYLSQHATAKYTLKNEITGEIITVHEEPIILYGLTVGDSGSNKTGCLNFFTELLDTVNNIDGADHTWESGSLEGLLKAMKENNGCVLGFFDEFSNFNDSLDKGSNGSAERSRFLTLYNGGRWSKKRKPAVTPY